MDIQSVSAEFRFDFLKVCNPLLKGRVRGEQFHDRVAGQGRDDEERVGTFDFCLGGRGGDLDSAADLFQGRDECTRVSCDLGAAPVGGKLAVP